jgi:hypothetical protein
MAVSCCNAAHWRTVGAGPRERFRSITVAPGTAPNHYSAPAQRTTADRITDSNEKRLLSISKSRRTSDTRVIVST